MLYPTMSTTRDAPTEGNDQNGPAGIIPRRRLRCWLLCVPESFQNTFTQNGALRLCPTAGLSQPHPRPSTANCCVNVLQLLSETMPTPQNDASKQSWHCGRCRGLNLCVPVLGKSRKKLDVSNWRTTNTPLLRACWNACGQLVVLP